MDTSDTTEEERSGIRESDRESDSSDGIGGEGEGRNDSPRDKDAVDSGDFEGLGWLTAVVVEGRGD